MTSADWAYLVPVIASLIGAVAAWVKAKAANDTVKNHVATHDQSQGPNQS